MTDRHNSEKLIRKSLRYNGYDYSNPGFYYVTICSQNHVCLFGKIENGEMILNDAGKMVERWYYELENKYQNVKCNEMVIMPNHIHFIIENTGINSKSGGATLIEIVQWFKTMTTNEYIRGVKQLGWPRFDGKLWQRSYWDHIIRNQKTHENICEYIYYNPINWKDDELYKP